MIVVAILSGLLIVVTGDDCGNLFNNLNHVSRVIMGRIDNRENFYFSSATTRFSYFGILGLIMLFVVGGIKWMLGCG
jgi:hypothetical protein